MLLEKNEEIAPEGIKRQSKTGNNIQSSAVGRQGTVLHGFRYRKLLTAILPHLLFSMVLDTENS